jgi:predicted dehydrogenase
MNNTNGADLPVGVIGVGSMGQNHARIYDQLSRTSLVGVFDVDDEQAAEIAAEYGTSPMEMDELLDAVSAVSIAVPTQFHFDVAKQCIEAGVATLIEKPIADDPSEGTELQELAATADVPIQVGHIERFNPAVQTAQKIADDLEIIAVNAKRLGPPLDREIKDSAVLDLMIHDIDIVLSLVDGEPESVTSNGVQQNQYATTTIEFDSGPLATLTASRLTQQKVRTLEITTEECVIEIDYIDQSVEIHRQSMPSYIEEKEGVRYRHESVVERPTVPSEEPLQSELDSFVTAVMTNSTPEVSIADGVRALELAQKIDSLARETTGGDEDE